MLENILTGDGAAATVVDTFAGADDRDVDNDNADADADADAD
jgi:hypothetical protein